jgi:hypothetical protein
VLGTVEYLAPERCLGAPATARSDVYSLGCTAYLLLCGRAPFEATDSRSLMLAHLNQPVPRLPYDLVELQPALDAAMAKEPAERPASAGVFAEAFAAAAAALTRPHEALAPQPTPRAAHADAAPQAPSSTQATVRTPGAGGGQPQGASESQEAYRVAIVAFVEAMRDDGAIADLQARLAELAVAAQVSYEATGPSGGDTVARVDAQVAGGPNAAEAFVRASLLAFGDAKRALVRSMPARVWHEASVPSGVDLSFLHERDDWRAWIQREGELDPM